MRVSESLPFKNELVVHTSGTSAITSLDAKNRRGVFIPCKHFQKQKLSISLKFQFVLKQKIG